MSNEQLAQLTQPQRDRLAFVELRLRFIGGIRRQDLVSRFGIQSAAASVTRAIHQKCPLAIEYHTISNGQTERQIVPFALIDNGLRWHVRAFDRKSQEFLDFVITRIRNPRVLKGDKPEQTDLGELRSLAASSRSRPEFCEAPGFGSGSAVSYGHCKNREQRNLLLDGQLVLISPYDPSAGFNVGNAMQRNKLIYALSDTSLVVSSDLDKGGTWAGAIEQLDKLRFVPVYVRSTGGSSPGLDALRSKGALPWPNPQDADAFESVRGRCAHASVVSAVRPRPVFCRRSDRACPSTPSIAKPPQAIEAPSESAPPPAKAPSSEPTEPTPEPAALVAPPSGVPPEPANPAVSAPEKPADALFVAVRKAIMPLLKTPMKDAEVAAAAALDVTTAQARAWLQRLADEGAIEKQKKPAGYIVKQSSLFE